MSEDNPKIPEITRVEVLSLKPDDIIICSIDGRVDHDTAEYIKRIIKERLHIENQIMVAEKGMKFEVLRKT